MSGMALDGKSFFYVNPLEALPEASLKDRRMHHVKLRRQKWFGCACCPPNLARVIASLGSYVHSSNDSAVYTHLFLGSEAKVTVAGKEIRLKIETQYPWEQKVCVSFGLGAPARFSYGFRIPGWCENFTLTLNGGNIGTSGSLEYKTGDGFAVISREWKDGDKLEIVFDMPVSIIETNPHVRDNIGKVAVTRGPVVYCLEEADNGKELFKVRAGCPKPDSIKVQYEKDLLEGVVTVSFKGKREKDWSSDALYRSASETVYEEKDLRWIPYYAWANRGEGEMTVWVKK
jgi:DUF1680 family protein